MPPSPRTASEIRKGVTPGRHRAVGWNWKNSMSIISAPARKARAMPSPVAISELVLNLKSWPAPPVARIRERQSNSVTEPVRRSRAFIPRTVPFSTRISVARQSSISLILDARTSRLSVTSICSPVASPPACRMRGALWAASRVRAILPSSVSKGTPKLTSSAMRAGASLARIRTAFSSHRPSPAIMVSRK